MEEREVKFSTGWQTRRSICMTETMTFSAVKAISLKKTKQKNRRNTFFRRAKVYVILWLCTTEAAKHNLTDLSWLNVVSSVFGWIRLWTCNIFFFLPSHGQSFLWKRCSISFAQLRQRLAASFRKTGNAERKHLQILYRFSHISARHKFQRRLNLA